MEVWMPLEHVLMILCYGLSLIPTENTSHWLDRIGIDPGKINVVYILVVTWHDQEEWVGCWRYCFWEIGKKQCSNSFILYCFLLWQILYNSVTSYPIPMGFASKCSILKLMRKWLKKLGIFRQVTYFLWSSHMSHNEIDLYNYASKRHHRITMGCIIRWCIQINAGYR